MSGYAQYNDSDLAVMLSQGNEDAFVEIYHRFWSIMYSSAFKRLQDCQLCEDLVQNIFVDVWERRRIVKIDNLSSYFKSAVRFQVIKVMTRQPRLINFTEELDVPLSRSGQIFNPVLEKEIMLLVVKWISSLPGKRKKIFTMYYDENLSTSQIANKLGLTQKTVQNQLNTATKSIRTRLSRFITVAILLHAYLN